MKEEKEAVSLFFLWCCKCHARSHRSLGLVYDLSYLLFQDKTLFPGYYQGNGGFNEREQSRINKRLKQGLKKKHRWKKWRRDIKPMHASTPHLFCQWRGPLNQAMVPMMEIQLLNAMLDSEEWSRQKVGGLEGRDDVEAGVLENISYGVGKVARVFVGIYRDISQLCSSIFCPPLCLLFFFGCISGNGYTSTQ